MINNKLRPILASFTFLLGTGTVLEAAPYSRSHMITAGKTSQPIGHAEFCRHFTSECRVRSSKTRPVQLTRKRWKEMDRVNKQINLAVEPITDYEYYKKEEHWTYPQRYGDCEDYVLLKRYMLMQKGWPASSLLITVVRQSNGDGHAVLTVRTDRADYVLDNLMPDIEQWNKTSYRFLKRQSTKHTGKWIKIKDKRRKLVANR